MWDPCALQGEDIATRQSMPGVSSTFFKGMQKEREIHASCHLEVQEDLHLEKYLTSFAIPSIHLTLAFPRAVTCLSLAFIVYPVLPEG